MYQDEHGSQCTEPPIGSHSLQKGGPLAAIAKNGHVLKFGPDKDDLPSNLKTPIVRQGIKKKASVFGGFCAKHDDQIFAPIETDIDQITVRHVALFCYRALCLEHYKKLRQHELMKVLLKQKRVEENPEIKKRIQWILEGNSKALADAKLPKYKLESAIHSRELSGFHGVAVEFDRVLPFSFTGGFAPERSFTGHQCLTKNPLSYKWSIVTAFAGAVRGKSIFIMGGFQLNKHHLVGAFIDSFKHHPETFRSAYVFNLALSHIENTFFRPSWYDSLSAKQKDFIFSKVPESGLFEPQPQYALVPSIKFNTAEVIRTEYFSFT